MLVAVRTSPFITTAGSVQPIAPVPGNWCTRPATASAIAAGRGGLRCLDADPARRLPGWRGRRVPPSRRSRRRRLQRANACRSPSSSVDEATCLAASFPTVSRLEDYALLGDRRTAALVSRAGSVDWWCSPRFDAPACFAALLGTPEHGRFLIAPSGATPNGATPDGPAGDVPSRRYLPGTMVLETEHETPTGRVRVVDCLALGHSRPLLVRLVEGLEGTVDMTVELIVRFDYGSIVPWVRRVDDRWRADRGSRRPRALHAGAAARARPDVDARSSPSPQGSRSRSCSAGSRRPTRAACPTTRPRSSRTLPRIGGDGRRGASTRASGASRCCVRCSRSRR